MIATCPACAKRYRLPDDAVPAEGRSVRCAACGNGWVAYPEAAAPVPAPDLEPALPFAAPPVPGPSVAAAPIPAASRAAIIDEPPPATIGAYRQRAPAASEERGPRRWLWIVPLLFVLIALGGVAVVEFAPANTFDPPRLGLPAIDTGAVRLSAPDLSGIALPKIAIPTIDLPPLDLTRVPLVGDRLEALVHPAAAPLSPLTISVAGERRHLANGGAVLILAGKIVNPTDADQSVPPIEARLVDPAGKVAYHWRIAAPVATLPAHHEVAFDSTAANYPPAAERLDLAFAR